MVVKVTTCSNTGNGTTVPINSQVNVPVSDNVKFYEVFYGGVLTITVYVGAPCAPTGVLHYPNECYVDFSYGGDQASGFTFSIW